MAPRSRHLSDLLAEQAGVAPESVAVISRGETLTYAELERRVDAFADAFRAMGLGRGSTLGLLGTNRWEWIVTALAAQRAGAVVAAFNTFAKAWDLEYMLAHSGAEVLVAIDRFRSRDYTSTILEILPELDEPDGHAGFARLPALREVIFIGDGPTPPGARRFGELTPAAEPVASAERPLCPATDDAFVLYTSGSSARPKAVPLQHFATVENGFHIGERMGLTAQDRVYIPIPLFWSFGASNALPATLTHGATLVLQEAFEPAEGLDLIETHSCSAAYVLPNITNALLRHERFDRQRTASLRTGLTLGAPDDIRRTAQELGIPEICNIYGQTETYGNCCVTPHQWSLERRANSQGPPLPHVEVRIVDRGSGEHLGPDAVGELQVRGYLTRGYKGDEAATREAFTEDGWYRTGDLASLDRDHALHFEARATEMIKTGGINVAPREVEELVASYPVVAEVAVIGAPDAGLGQVVVAVVVARENQQLDPDELRAFCKSRVAIYKVPARIVLVDELPKTDTGKLSKRMLVERYGSSEASA